MTQSVQVELIRFFSQGSGQWIALALVIGAVAAWTKQQVAPVPVPVRRRSRRR
jgi:hypothetical protein